MELSQRICAKDTPDREAALNEFTNATIEHLFRSFAIVARKWGLRDITDYFNDTYSDFFVYTLKKGQQKELIENLCGAFYRIGLRKMSKAAKGNKNLPIKGLDDVTVNMLIQDDPEIERILNPAPDEQALIEKAMAMLSEDDRRILSMYYYEGLSHKEIAERLGITEEVSKNRLSRARKRLRDNIDDLLNP